MTYLNNLHILIAEDDEDDAMIIEESFAGNEHFTTISMVKNGQELVNYLDNNPIPDVILTDINMPLMDGIEALKVIFSRQYTIPCFVYSTSINLMYEVECKKMGVKAYLVKPYSLEDFNLIPNEIITVLSRE